MEIYVVVSHFIYIYIYIHKYGYTLSTKNQETKYQFYWSIRVVSFTDGHGAAVVK